jgi:cysteinyl-tRNA synthetase
MYKAIEVQLSKQFERTGFDVDPTSLFLPIPLEKHGDEKLDGYLTEFDDALFEELNTSKCLPIVEEVLGHPLMPDDVRWHILATMEDALGLGLGKLKREDLRIRPKTAIITEAQIETALAARKEARASKDFAKSDAIRDDLIAKGVEVMDGDPLGWDWKLDV